MGENQPLFVSTTVMVKGLKNADANDQEETVISATGALYSILQHL